MKNNPCKLQIFTYILIIFIYKTFYPLLITQLQYSLFTGKQVLNNRIFSIAELISILLTRKGILQLIR